MFPELIHIPLMKGLPRTGKGKSNGTDLAMGDAVAQHPPLVHFHFIPEYPVHPHQCWDCYICLHRTDLFVFSCCCVVVLASLQIQSPADITLHLSHQWTSSEETVLYLCFCHIVLYQGELGTCHSLSTQAGKAAVSSSANKEPQNTDVQKVTFHLHSPSFLITFQTVHDTR